MKPSISSGLWATSSLLSLVVADGAGTLRINIIKNRQVESQQLSKRGTVQTTLGNAESMGLYYANATIGTPGQPFMMQVDTGSSDVWVPSSSASICTDKSQGGCTGGTFDSSASSTFVIVGKDEFNISYVDNTGSTGDYFQDTFTMSGAKLKSFEMGLATETSIPYGLIGIAYSNSEANVFTGNGTVYPNLVDSLVNQGLIPTQAYSLWLDDIEATSGQILFGGIDTAKYQGTLSSLEIYPDSESGTDQITSFTVAFTSLSATSSSGTDSFTPSGYAEAAILDSGTTLTLLPDDLAQVLFQEVGATTDQTLGVIVPCSLGQIDGTINFGFGGSGGPTIKVPVSELVIPVLDDQGNPPTYTNGETACSFGIEPAQGRPVLFGDTFLRSAYVVYDLSNNRIGIAQTDFNATESNIVAFASLGAPIPSATTAQGDISVTQTATGHPRGSAGITAGGNATPTVIGSPANTLSAAGGFAATGSDTAPSPAQTSHKSAAGAGPEPFAWQAVAVLGTSMGMMLLGSGVLAWF